MIMLEKKYIVTAKLIVLILYNRSLQIIKQYLEYFCVVCLLCY